MARDLLAEHIQFVRKHCHYHRDVIRVLEQCHASNDFSAPVLGTKMLKHLDTRSPQNTRVDE